MAIKKQLSSEPPTMRGICAVCLCTDDDGCPEGCDWADRAHTLCTACRPLGPNERLAKRRERMQELEMRFGELMEELSLFHSRLSVAMSIPMVSTAEV